MREGKGRGEPTVLIKLGVAAGEALEGYDLPIVVR